MHLLGLSRLLVIVGVLNSALDGSCKQEKRQVVAALSHIPPFDYIIFSSNGSFYSVGAAKSFMEWIALKMGFSLKFVYPTKEEISVKGNEAAIDYVANGKADVTVNGFGVTRARAARVDFGTYHNWEEGHRMVVPRPGEQDRLFAFIDPFDLNVWVLTGISFVTVSCTMGLLTWARIRFDNLAATKKRNDRVADYLGQYFLYNVNVLTTHGDYLSESRCSFLIAVGCWLLGASVLVYGYSSIVVSSITLPKQLPSLNTLDDVVAHPFVSLIIRTDTYIGDLINTSNDVPLYKAIREKALKRPESIGNEGVINSTKLLLTGKYAYTFVETAVKYTMASQYTIEKKCKFKLSSRLAVMNSYFYHTFQKGTKHLARDISIGAMQLAETGLVQYWIKNLPFFPKADKCFNNDAKKTSNQIISIKLIDLTSAFFILGIGLMCSALAFVAELAIFYRLQRQGRLKSQAKQETQ